MSFLTPIWLLGLLPWAALTLWLLWGRRPRVMVPFVALWQISAVDVRAKRNLQTPPMAVALVIACLLLALLAAAGPLARGWGGGSDVPITVLLDRGASMSARTRDHSQYRFQERTHALAAAMIKTGGPSLPVHLVDLADSSEKNVRADQLATTVDARLPTFIDTRGALQTAIREASRDTTNPIVAVTDQAVDAMNVNVVRVAPPENVRDVAISQLAVRRSPIRQIMVQITNEGVTARTATLRVTSGDWQDSKVITLPASGSEQNYFLNAERLGDVTRAELTDIDDDFSPNNQRIVMREGNWARIDATIPLSPAMKRLLDVYRAHRPASPGASSIAIVAQTSALADDAPGLVLDIPTDAAPVSIGPITTAPHPLLHSVDANSLPKAMAISPDAPAWTPIVRAGERVLVAVREEPARQIWVGFDPTDWSGSPDFVVFFSGCMDWLSAGGAQDVSHPLSEWSAEWKRVDPASARSPVDPQPGIYRRQDGAERALDLPPIHFASEANLAWQKALDRLIAARRPGMQLGGGFLITSLLCLCGAALTWRRRPSSDRLALASEATVEALIS